MLRDALERRRIKFKLRFKGIKNLYDCDGLTVYERNLSDVALVEDLKLSQVFSLGGFKWGIRSENGDIILRKKTAEYCNRVSSFTKR